MREGQTDSHSVYNAASGPNATNLRPRKSSTLFLLLKETQQLLRGRELSSGFFPVVSQPWFCTSCTFRCMSVLGLTWWAYSGRVWKQDSLSGTGGGGPLLKGRGDHEGLKVASEPSLSFSP